MISIIISIIAIGLIIVVHEFGHFLSAKLLGVGVVEFSIGMGPRLLSFVRGNTRYSLKAFFFGGSCMMVSDEAFSEERESGVSEKTRETDSEASAKKAEDAEAFKEEAEGVKEDAAEDAAELDGRLYQKAQSFESKAPWKRFCIIAAGPVFNILMAFLLSLFLTAQTGYDAPVVYEVEAGMPASDTGIRAGDRILSIGGEKVNVYRDIQLYLLMNQDRFAEGSEIELSYRDAEGKDYSIVLAPAFAEDTGSYRMGLRFSAEYKRAETVPELLRYSAYNVQFCIRSSIKSIQLLFSGRVSAEDVMGPVRMVAVTADTVDTAADYGLMTTVLSLFDLMILISASLGVMNLLPIPALDGGQLLFVLFELVFRRPVPREFAVRVNLFGMMLLLLFMFYVMFQDILFMIR